MENDGAGVVVPPSSAIRGHWLAFFALVVVAYVVTAAFHEDWASAFGLVTVPTVVGYFIVRRVSGLCSFATRYAAFAVLLCMLIGGDVGRAVAKTGDDVRGGCIDNNQWVAQLARAEDKQSFCTCLADKMKWPTARTVAAAFITFREPTPMQDDPVMTAVATDAFKQCAALLPRS
ncbi:hypothetical protein [Mesorhizobium sp. Cs1299R1N3]|uniref:hypothetical protein n=1 Tax=Mesorhizobium sp. Cs1299R1N3 TaxID=3015173 RepID=UPI00301C7571